MCLTRGSLWQAGWSGGPAFRSQIGPWRHSTASGKARALPGWRDGARWHSPAGSAVPLRPGHARSLPAAS
eukprot:1731928-Alexandrium_andersonii.AAC.1